MKIILLFLQLLLPYFLFSQSIDIRMKSRQFTLNEKINFVVINKDSIDRFLNIQLERRDFESKKWVSYSSDIFADPSSPLELTLKVSKNEFIERSFINRESNWIDSPKFSKKKNELLRNKYKTGLFRLRVLSGYGEQYKKYIDFSNSFKIHS